MSKYIWMGPQVSFHIMFHLLYAFNFTMTLIDKQIYNYSREMYIFYNLFLVILIPLVLLWMTSWHAALQIILIAIILISLNITNSRYIFHRVEWTFICNYIFQCLLKHHSCVIQKFCIWHSKVLDNNLLDIMKYSNHAYSCFSLKIFTLDQYFTDNILTNCFQDKINSL